MVTKHLDSDLLSVEPPNGKHSQINGSSLSKGSSNASEEERQALYLRPEDRSLTAKKDNANDAKILFVFPPEPVNTFKMKE